MEKVGALRVGVDRDMLLRTLRDYIKDPQRKSRKPLAAMEVTKTLGCNGVLRIDVNTDMAL